MSRGACPHCGKGGNKLHAADCKLVGDLHAALDYCARYHCAGDCGQPHNQKERSEYAGAVLNAFDALEREARRPLKDAMDAIRAKAKDSI